MRGQDAMLSAAQKKQVDTQRDTQESDGEKRQEGCVSRVGTVVTHSLE